MTHARAKRYFMKWQRYTARHPQAGPSFFMYHTAYVKAHDCVSRTGRAAPNGIRQPWMIRTAIRGWVS